LTPAEGVGLFLDWFGDCCLCISTGISIPLDVGNPKLLVFEKFGGGGRRGIEERKKEGSSLNAPGKLLKNSSSSNKCGFEPANDRRELLCPNFWPLRNESWSRKKGSSKWGGNPPGCLFPSRLEGVPFSLNPTLRHFHYEAIEGNLMHILSTYILNG